MKRNGVTKENFISWKNQCQNDDEAQDYVTLNKGFGDKCFCSLVKEESAEAYRQQLLFCYLLRRRRRRFSPRIERSRGQPSVLAADREKFKCMQWQAGTSITCEHIQLLIEKLFVGSLRSASSRTSRRRRRRRATAVTLWSGAQAAAAAAGSCLSLTSQNSRLLVRTRNSCWSKSRDPQTAVESD